MTIIPRIWLRENSVENLPSEERLFSIDASTQLRGVCHWQAQRKNRPTVLLLHGLEGCSESHYLLGLSRKGWKAGYNIIRLNQRNCGGTEHLTPTLYHSGLSQDYSTIIRELSSRDGLEQIWMIGYSMGGNLTLKMAGEVGSTLPALQGVMAVCPNIEPNICVTALERPSNWMYQRYFLKRLKARLQRKSKLFHDVYDLSPLPHIRSMREFDNIYTAPDGGFIDAEDYYRQAGAHQVLDRIQIPTLIVTAQDDPFIPYSMFFISAIQHNPHITLLAPSHGGHCGFYQRFHPQEDSYWVENRMIEFVGKEAHTKGSRGADPTP